MTGQSIGPTSSVPEPPAKHDAAILLALLESEPAAVRRTPWTWSVLSQEESAALKRMVRRWVADYNVVHAVTSRELIPDCWPLHPGLAYDLAVMVWVYYDTHHDRRTTPLMAGDYHLRYLPGFRSRLDHLLGSDPAGCRAGEHPASWRTIPGDVLRPADRLQAKDSGEARRQELHFSFGFSVGSARSSTAFRAPTGH